MGDFGAMCPPVLSITIMKTPNEVISFGAVVIIPPEEFRDFREPNAIMCLPSSALVYNTEITHHLSCVCHLIYQHIALVVYSQTTGALIFIKF